MERERRVVLYNYLGLTKLIAFHLRTIPKLQGYVVLVVEL